jgi:hypothetical protein
MSTNTLTKSGKALSNVTTWERYASACVENQVWTNPIWPEFVEAEAIALAEAYGFELFTASSKQGLHGREIVRKYVRKPQSFWSEFATGLGFVFIQDGDALATEWRV